MKPTSGNFSQRYQGELAQLNRDVALLQRRLQHQPGMPDLVTRHLAFAAETLAHLESTQARKSRPRASQFAAAPGPNPRINKFGA